MLKERRQHFGFEGDNLKTAKFKDILTRSGSITLDDIQLIEKSHYTVRSSSTSNSYDVDLTSLTCSCADYPLIAFCKHLAAVKREFCVLELEGLASANSSLSQAELCPNDTPLEPFPAGVQVESDSVVVRISNPLPTLQLAQKLEHIAACLRHNDPNFLAPEDIFSLTENIDKIMGNVNQSRSSLLPQRVPNIPPNVKGWTETKAVMMPPKKTRSKRAGDPAYGAGEKSGKKAKIKISSSQVSLSSTTSLHHPQAIPHRLIPQTVTTPEPTPQFYHYPPLHLPAQSTILPVTPASSSSYYRTQTYHYS